MGGVKLAIELLLTLIWRKK